MRIRTFLLTMTLALAISGLTGCSSNEKKEKYYIVENSIIEESEKTPLQLKMDSYQDYQEIDPNEEVDHKYLEQVKNQMVVHQFHLYTQFDDFGLRNHSGTIEETLNHWADSQTTVEYLKTLIVPSYFTYREGYKNWMKVFDSGAISEIDGTNIFWADEYTVIYSTEEELDKAFENAEKNSEKQYRLNYLEEDEVIN